MTSAVVNPFVKATKTQARLRLGIIGPAGSGKTYTALRVARALVGAEGRIALIDTEHGSASKYADLTDFDTLSLESYHPERYIDAIHAAEAAGYDVVIIDSLSHAWSGKDGALELVDRAAARAKSSNSYVAWRDVTPLHNRLVDTILGARLHVIATMRSKTEYVLETVNGKQVPRKVGMAPIQRDGMEYEFDVTGDIDLDHKLAITKTRCAVLDGVVVDRPGEEFAETLRAWLTDGAPMPPDADELVAALGDALKAAAMSSRDLGPLLGTVSRETILRWLRANGNDVAAMVSAAQGEQAAVAAEAAERAKAESTGAPTEIEGEPPASDGVAGDA